jgi:hypothetical protein
MANGRKNYFRHSFFARNDIKLRKLRDELGVGFYFYFFTLLEQCGEESSDNLRENYEFHDSIIRSLWGVNLKKSEHVASVMSAVGLLFFEKREKTFYFEIPNFAKYLGKYEIKNESNTPNKRKENKRKENINVSAEENSADAAKKEISDNATALRLTPEQIHGLWDKKMVPKGFTRTASMFPIPRAVREIIIIEKQMLSMGITWDDYFEKIDKIITRPEYRKGITSYLDSTKFMQVMENQRPEIAKKQNDSEEEKIKNALDFLRGTTNAEL